MTHTEAALWTGNLHSSKGLSPYLPGDFEFVRIWLPVCLAPIPQGLGRARRLKYSSLEIKTFSHDMAFKAYEMLFAAG